VLLSDQFLKQKLKIFLLNFDFYESKAILFAGLLACMGRGEVHAGFWWGN
jgi:hypothetical protein